MAKPGGGGITRFGRTSQSQLYSRSNEPRVRGFASGLHSRSQSFALRSLDPFISLPLYEIPSGLTAATGWLEKIIEFIKKLARRLFFFWRGGVETAKVIQGSSKIHHKNVLFLAGLKFNNS